MRVCRRLFSCESATLVVGGERGQTREGMGDGGSKYLYSPVQGHVGQATRNYS